MTFKLSLVLALTMAVCSATPQLSAQCRSAGSGRVNFGPQVYQGMNYTPLAYAQSYSRAAAYNTSMVSSNAMYQVAMASQRQQQELMYREMMIQQSQVNEMQQKLDQEQFSQRQAQAKQKQAELKEKKLQLAEARKEKARQNRVTNPVSKPISD